MLFERAKAILICCAFLVAILATMRNELCEERVLVRHNSKKPHLALRGLPRHEVDMRITLHHEVTKSAKATSLTKH